MTHLVFFDNVGGWIGADFIDWICFVVIANCSVMIVVSYVIDLVMLFIAITAFIAVFFAALFIFVFTDTTDFVFIVDGDGVIANLCNFVVSDWSADCIIFFVECLLMVIMLSFIAVEYECTFVDTVEVWFSGAFRICVDDIGNFAVVSA